MKNLKQITVPFFAMIGLFTLILDTKTAVQGAQEGLWLCIRVLIPSLFPFIVVSGYFCKAYSTLKLPFLRPIIHICKLPQGTEPLLIIGLLGGYPVGAKAIADAYVRRQLTAKAAQRMLSFCSNAGPAFIFGIAGGIFDNILISWLLLIILILSAIITGCLIPGDDRSVTAQTAQDAISFTKILENSLSAMASICGWVILFRVLLTMLKRWILWFLPGIVQLALTGFMELSNGCVGLGQINNDGIRFIMCAGFLSFGGVCVLLQTASVTGKLGIGLYFPGKIIQCLISLILSGICQALIFKHDNNLPIWFIIIPLALMVCILTLIKLHQNKKNSSISKQNVV